MNKYRFISVLKHKISKSKQALFKHSKTVFLSLPWVMHSVYINIRDT